MPLDNKKYTEATVDIKSPEFSKFRMPMFSPFRVDGVQAFKAMTKPSEKQPISREYTVFRLKYHPNSNPNVHIETLLFNQEWEQIRGLLALKGGAEQTLLSATLDVSQQPQKLIFTATQG